MRQIFKMILILCVISGFFYLYQDAGMTRKEKKENPNEVLLEIIEGNKDSTLAAPGGVLRRSAAIKNKGPVPAYVFLEVGVPERNGTTLFHFNVGDNWKLFKKLGKEDGLQRYLYIYGSEKECKPLQPGEITSPLYEELRFIKNTEGFKLNYGLVTYGLDVDNAYNQTEPQYIWPIISESIMKGAVKDNE